MPDFCILGHPQRTELVFPTGVFACCTYLGHRSHSVPQIWLLFLHGVLVLATCLPGLESQQGLLQVQCSPLLPATEANKRPHCMLAPATPTIPNVVSVAGGNSESYPPDVWAWSLNPRTVRGPSYHPRMVRGPSYHF